MFMWTFESMRSGQTWTDQGKEQTMHLRQKEQHVLRRILRIQFSEQVGRCGK